MCLWMFRVTEVMDRAMAPVRAILAPLLTEAELANSIMAFVGYDIATPLMNVTLVISEKQKGGFECGYPGLFRSPSFLMDVTRTRCLSWVCAATTVNCLFVLAA